MIKPGENIINIVYNYRLQSRTRPTGPEFESCEQDCRCALLMSHTHWDETAFQFFHVFHSVIALIDLEIEQLNF